MLRIWCLIIFLITSSNYQVAFAATLDSLLNTYQVINFDQNPENIERLKTLSLESESFIGANTSLSNVTSDPKWEKLNNRFRRLHNFLEIHNTLKECLTTQGDKRNLSARIIDAAGNEAIVNVDCSMTSLSPFQSVEALTGQMKDVVSLENVKTMFNGLVDRSLTNSVRSYAHFNYQYTQDGVSVDKMVEDLCLKKGMLTNTNTCSEKEQNEIREVIEKDLQSYAKANVKRYGKDEIVSGLNEKVDSINQKLDEVSSKIQVDQGSVNWFWWDSSDPLYDEQADKAFNEYALAYQTEVATPPGLIMMSDHMQESIGRLKTKDDSSQDYFGSDKSDDLVEVSDSSNNTTRYEFQHHDRVDAKDVEEAITDSKNQIVEQVFNLRDLKNETIKPNSTVNKYRESIKKLVKTNPVAIGQFLISNPTYSSEVCTAIQTINTDDVSDEKWDNVMMYGGMAVGGVLLLTGVGSAVGAAMIGTSAAATSTTLAAVTVWSAIGGGALTAAELTYFGNSAYQSYVEQAEIKNSFLSGTNDPAALADLREAMNRYEDAKFNAIIAGVLGPLDLVGLKSALKVMSTMDANAKLDKLVSLAQSIEDKLGAKIAQEKALAAGKIAENAEQLRLLKKEKSLTFSLQDKEVSISMDRFGHIMFGDFEKSNDGLLTLKSGLHSRAAFYKFLVQREDLKIHRDAMAPRAIKADNMTPEENTVEMYTFPNGVTLVQFPDRAFKNSDARAKTNVPAERGEIYSQGKTLFPIQWSQAKILESIRLTVEKPDRFPIWIGKGKNLRLEYYRKIDDVDMIVIVKQDGSIDTAHPIIPQNSLDNNGASRVGNQAERRKPNVVLDKELSEFKLKMNIFFSLENAQNKKTPKPGGINYRKFITDFFENNEITDFKNYNKADEIIEELSFALRQEKILSRQNLPKLDAYLRRKFSKKMKLISGNRSNDLDRAHNEAREEVMTYGTQQEKVSFALMEKMTELLETLNTFDKSTPLTIATIRKILKDQNIEPANQVELAKIANELRSLYLIQKPKPYFNEYPILKKVFTERFKKIYTDLNEHFPMNTREEKIDWFLKDNVSDITNDIYFLKLEKQKKSKELLTAIEINKYMVRKWGIDILAHENSVELMQDFQKIDDLEAFMNTDEINKYPALKKLFEARFQEQFPE